MNFTKLESLKNLILPKLKNIDFYIINNSNIYSEYSQDQMKSENLAIGFAIAIEQVLKLSNNESVANSKLYEL